jgi:aminoglycoside phosphotransferase (APT) family kinase protein
VPRVYACETDERVLGAPFLLMQRLTGRGAPDWPSYVREGWIHDLDERDREQLWVNGIEAVAAVHRTELTREACRDLTLPVSAATLLDQALGYWRRFLGFVSEGGDYPVLEAAVDWLERERPSIEFTPRLVWGDASLRNMLFDGLKPCALLDFEFAHVGIAAFDIAFYAMMDYVMAEGFAGGAPRLSGFFGVQRTLDRYEQITGWAVPEREYFLRMAVTYMSLATTRVYQRLAREGRVPPETVAANPPLAILGRILSSGTLPD